MTRAIRIAVAAALLCTLAPRARADRMPVEADEFAELIDKAYQANHLSEAWRLSERAVAAHPDDAALRHTYGYILHELAHFRKAAEQLERALTLDPDNRDIVVTLAWSQWASGNSDRARELSALATQKWPDDEEVIDLADNIATETRILSGKKLQHEHGSASDFVNRFCAKVEGGNLVDALLDDLDPELIDALVRSSPGAGARREWMKGFVKGITNSWNEQFANKGNRYHGYEVDNEAEEHPDGSVVVWVNLLMKRQWSAKDVDRIRRYFADPDLHHLIDPEMKRILDGLEPADRERYLAAQTAYWAASYAPLAFTVAKRGDRWYITDVVANKTAKLSELGTTVALLQDKGMVPTTDKPNFAYTLGKGVGKLLVALFLLWLVARIWRRITR